MSDEKEILRAAERQGVLGWVLNVINEELEKGYNERGMTKEAEGFAQRVITRLKWARDQESDELSEWFDKKYTT